MAVAKLSIELEARLARLEGDLSRATRVVEREASRMEKAFASSSAAFAKLTGLIASVGSATALVNLGRSALNSVSAMKDFADATGASIENASALDALALRTGRTLGDFQGAVLKLNQALQEGSENSAQAKALQAIGLSVRELRALDPAAALQRVADGLLKVDDAAQRARTAQQLFGRSVGEVVPLLNDLAENGQLVARISTEQAEKVDRLNKQITSLQGSFKLLTQELALEFVPALAEAGIRFQEAIRRFGGFGGALRTGLSEGLRGNVFRDAGEGVRFYVDKLKDLEKQRDVIASNTNPVARRGGLLDIDKEIEQARKLEAFYRDVFRQTAPDLGQTDRRELARRPRPGRLVAPFGTPVEPERPQPRATAGRAARPNPLQIPDVPSVTEAALRRIEQVSSIRIGDLRRELQLLVELGANGNAAALEALPALADEIARLDPAAQAAAQRLQDLADQQDRLNSLLAQTPQGRLRAVTEEIEFLNAQFEAGKIQDVDEWAAAVRNATSQLGTNAERVESVGRDLGLTFASAAEEAITNFNNLRDVLKGLEQDILRIFTRKLVTEPLSNALGGLLDGVLSGGGGGKLLGSVGSFLSGLLGSANGNAFGPAGALAFANGGVVDRPTLFGFGGNRTGLMGEAGPEAILPLRRGRDGRLGVASAGGQQNINITVQVQAQPQMSRDTALQQGASIGRGIQRALARNG